MHSSRVGDNRFGTSAVTGMISSVRKRQERAWVLSGSILATGFRDALVGLRAGRSTILFSFVVLSLGLATTTVTFSVVDAVALQPLPFGAPDRLVAVSLPSPIPTSILPATPRDYFDWSERSTAFASLGAARGQRPLRWHQQGQTADLSVMAVTANLFTVLEVPMAAGRPFERRDELAGATGTLILSHATWTRDFGGDPRILGSELQFDDGPREVIGVLPPGVRYPITAGPPVEAYIPYVPTPEDRANGRAFGMFVVGRLKPQMSVEQARADVGRYSSAMVQGLPD